MANNDQPLYQCADVAMVRAAAHAELHLPDWPDLTDDTPAGVARWCVWLREVWALEVVADAVGHASPTLARQVNRVCAVAVPDPRHAGRTVRSMVGYLLRLQYRPTPFGLFAGVAPVSFGPELTARWGTSHRAVARAGATWIAEVITRLEACPQLLARLTVMTNNTVFVRGGRLVVPHPPPTGADSRTGPIEVSMRCTPAVRVAVEAARSPIRCDELAGKLTAEFPMAPPSRISELVTGLVDRRVLISNLHAPSTVIDAFEYLLTQLDSAGDVPQVAELLDQLRAIGAELARHNSAATGTASRRIRTPLSETMTALAATPGQPLAVDLLVDCSLVLPQQVAQEAETAASVLARLTAYSFGSAALKTYHNRFFERYGIGSLVPLLDVVDPDVGLGFPAGYLDAEPEPVAPMTDRDQRLLALAQAAALDQQQEIVLDQQMVADLAVGDQTRVQVPPHMELRFRLHASCRAALERGEFVLDVVSASRGAGTTTGRFLGLLEPPDQERTATVLTELPTSDPATMAVQLSFPPLAARDAHVTRAPELLPAVISLAEHRRPSGTVIDLKDLAVACDRRRLYLASLSRGRRLEPTVLHALDLRAHTPPLARFLTEVGRAQAAAVTAFDWGAADRLPFLPRVRYRNTIMAAARWRLDTAELAGRGAPWPEWQEAITAWRCRRRVPTVVLLTEGDQLLMLDLGQSSHLALLRARLNRAGHAVFTEAPGPGAHGWFDGRGHEIVVTMTAAQPPQWPAVPPVTASRLIGRDHGHLPGASMWCHAKLYGHSDRQAEILAEHLPGLLAEWDKPPAWWYMRYCDPECHLRLRIALRDAAEFGLAAQRVGTWADRLRHLGLLRDVQFATSYPETGRWGTGEVMVAAEEVFGTDSRALVAQFAQPSRPHPHALAAANFVAITTGFTGSTEAGLEWLVEHARIEPSPALDRAVLAQAVRLADPADGWAALRAAPGGQAITEAWEPRHQALRHYRALLADTDGIDPDIVLDSLLHAHHIRAAGIDKTGERVCVRLARAAALARTRP